MNPPRSKYLIRGATLFATLSLGALFLEPVAGAATTVSAPPRSGSQTPLSAAQAQALSKNVNDKVIVVFKNQVTGIPDTAAGAARRTESVDQAQASVVAEMAETHASHVMRYQVIDAVAATVSAGEAKRLSANPAVAEVVKDQQIELGDASPAIPRSSDETAASSALPPGTCPASGKVQLDPQAVETVHAAEPAGGPPSAQSLGYTGKGVTVAFIADGLDIHNPDFIRPDGKPVFVDYQDFSGTGTAAPTDGAEAYEDSSSIAAQGREVYNIQTYAGLPVKCDIRILGVAPGASLVGLNVFGSSNFAFNSVFLEAINYAVNHDHVNVLNESFGANPFPDSATLDLDRMADDAAVAAGVTVDVSTGDAGITSTIGSPATDPLVISAGATTTYRAYEQTGIGGITYPGVNGWINNNISGLSSGGFDQAGGTLDVVAPGDLNWALCTPKPKIYEACTNFFGAPASIELAGGTSEAAPLTSGTAALVIQAYEEHHGGTPPTPAIVKQIIVSTAEDISAPGDQQGAGLIDAYAAVQAAASYPGGTSKPTGDGLLKNSTQLNVVAPASTTSSLSETVTNTGASTQVVSLSTRTLAPYRNDKSGAVMLEDSTGNGAVITFKVPAGQARLNGSVAYTTPGTSFDFDGAVDLSLISPSGKLAEFDLPQGAGNYDNTQVADPQPGTWTALISSAPSADGGTTGPVHYAFSSAVWAHFGKLSASSLTIGPGASKSFTLSVATPSSPGDTAGSIVLTSNADEPGFAKTTTVPVTLRSLIPTPHPSTSFTGTLTGGNGRDFNTGQANFYQVEVPAGTKELNASVSTSNPANTFYAQLIDPVTGEAASTAATGIPGASGNGATVIVPEAGAQLHVLDPGPGLWALAINFYNQVSGTAVSQPFKVTLDSTSVPVSSSLPDSSGATLASGVAKTVYVKVTNNGSTPEAYFVDARLNQNVQMGLAALTTNQITDPIVSTNIPMYLVPTHTSSVTASATSTAPIFFDAWWSYGDPDLPSTSSPFSDSASVTYNANPVVAGEWGITPFQDGPYGAHGLPPVTVTTSLSATTQEFDSAVSSTTGDLWMESVDPSAAIDPVVVAPGQTVSIPVTITPDASVGSTVQGTLYVDDVTLVNGEATWNELATNIIQAGDLAAVPYEYKVG
jgi:subtilisin family serine protease